MMSGEGGRPQEVEWYSSGQTVQRFYSNQCLFVQSVEPIGQGSFVPSLPAMPVIVQPVV
jgi:hypothetical protein